MFKCINCGKLINEIGAGSQHRNHCPFCLWSLHLDLRKPGDRKANCGGKMKPIGLAFKSEGKKKQGELCIVHQCQRCQVLSKNRIAADDDPKKLIEVFKRSWSYTNNVGINLLDETESNEVITQLFGRPNLEKYLSLLKD